MKFREIQTNLQFFRANIQNLYKQKIQPGSRQEQIASQLKSSYNDEVFKLIQLKEKEFLTIKRELDNFVSEISFVKEKIRGQQGIHLISPASFNSIQSSLEVLSQISQNNSIGISEFSQLLEKLRLEIPQLQNLKIQFQSKIQQLSSEKFKYETELNNLKISSSNQGFNYKDPNKICECINQREEYLKEIEKYKQMIENLEQDLKNNEAELLKLDNERLFIVRNSPNQQYPPQFIGVKNEQAKQVNESSPSKFHFIFLYNLSEKTNFQMIKTHKAKKNIEQSIKIIIEKLKITSSQNSKISFLYFDSKNQIDYNKDLKPKDYKKPYLPQSQGLKEFDLTIMLKHYIEPWLDEKSEQDFSPKIFFLSHGTMLNSTETIDNLNRLFEKHRNRNFAFFCFDAGGSKFSQQDINQRQQLTAAGNGGTYLINISKYPKKFSMFQTNIKEKDLDNLSQVISSSTFSSIQDLKPKPQIVQVVQVQQQLRIIDEQLNENKRVNQKLSLQKQEYEQSIEQTTDLINSLQKEQDSRTYIQIQNDSEKEIRLAKQKVEEIEQEIQNSTSNFQNEIQIYEDLRNIIKVDYTVLETIEDLKKFLLQFTQWSQQVVDKIKKYQENKINNIDEIQNDISYIQNNLQVVQDFQELEVCQFHTYLAF